jgi:hypothetical protein
MGRWDEPGIGKLERTSFSVSLDRVRSVHWLGHGTTFVHNIDGQSKSKRENNTMPVFALILLSTFQSRSTNKNVSTMARPSNVNEGLTQAVGRRSKSLTIYGRHNRIKRLSRVYIYLYHLKRFCSQVDLGLRLTKVEAHVGLKIL